MGEIFQPKDFRFRKKITHAQFPLSRLLLRLNSREISQQNGSGSYAKKLQTTVVVYFNILIPKELKCAIPLNPLLAKHFFDIPFLETRHFLGKKY